MGARRFSCLAKKVLPTDTWCCFFVDVANFLLEFTSCTLKKNVHVTPIVVLQLFIIIFLGEVARWSVPSRNG